MGFQIQEDEFNAWAYHQGLKHNKPLKKIPCENRKLNIFCILVRTQILVMEYEFEP